jgi:uncharacterized protein DUF5317
LDKRPSEPSHARADDPDRMFLGLVLLLCLASVPLLGGRFGALADLQPRAGWLPMAAIAIQIVIISILPGGGAGIHAAAHLASYAMLVAFVWANRHLPGMALIALGGGSNLLAISVNGGVMPADPNTVASAAVHKVDGKFLNSAPVAHPHLLFLGDRIAIPPSWPIHAVFSIGDCLLMLGALVLLHVVCRSSLGRALGRVRPLAPAAAPAPAR